MKLSTALVASVLVAVAAARAHVFPSNIEVDKILTDDVTYRQYFGCLTGAGECTSEGKAIKDILPDALATQCAKCTPDELREVRKVIEFLLEKKPVDYAVLEKIYDPTGITRSKFQKPN